MTQEQQGPTDAADLRPRFEELRRQEEPAAPDFDQTWEAATARARRRSRRTPVLLGSAALVAAAALALLIVARPRPQATDDTAPTPAASRGGPPDTAPPPLRFLLAPPAQVAIHLDPIDPNRYGLNRVLENAASGAE